MITGLDQEVSTMAKKDELKHSKLKRRATASRIGIGHRFDWAALSFTSGVSNYTNY